MKTNASNDCRIQNVTLLYNHLPTLSPINHTAHRNRLIYNGYYILYYDIFRVAAITRADIITLSGVNGFINFCVPTLYNYIRVYNVGDDLLFFCQQMTLIV